MGRLTRDPELRRTQSGIPVASFTLAVERRYSKDKEKQDVDFIDIVAWRASGEFAAKYFTKGQLAAVTGRLQIRQWTDKEGNKRRNAEVVADNIYFAESRKSREGAGSYSSFSYDDNDAPSPSFEARYDFSGSPFAELEEDDGELPF